MPIDGLELPAAEAQKYDEIQFATAGAEARVYIARYVPTDQRVALKVLIPRAGSEAASTRRERRFVEEAKILRERSGPHVVRVYDLFDVTLNGVATKAFAMEWLPQTLQEVIGAHPEGLPTPELERLLRGTLAGLEVLHGSGIAVRDVRPENLLLDADGVPKLADLGLARTDDSAASLVESSRYLAPEVLDGSIRSGYDGDPPPAAYFASDLYALGMIFYEAAVGAEGWETVPALASVFGAAGAGSGLDRNQRWREWHLNRSLSLPPLQSVRSNVDAEIAATIDALVAKERDVRPRTVAAIYAMLGAASGQRPTAKRIRGKANEKGDRASRRSIAWWLSRAAIPVATAAALAFFVWAMIGRSPGGGTPSVSGSSLSPDTVQSTNRQPAPPKQATLRITSEPSDAGIYLDETYRGQTPAAVAELEVDGTHTVELRKRDHLPWRDTIAITDSLQTLHAQLQPEPDRMLDLTVTSKPSGSTVHVDGAVIGMTPTTARRLLVGRTYQVRIEREGYGPWAKAVPVTEPSEPVHAVLSPLLAGLRVVTEPPGAAIYLNGKQYGFTPRNVTGIRGSEVDLQLQLTGYERHIERVKLVSGQTIARSVVLNPRSADAGLERPVTQGDATQGWGWLGVVIQNLDDDLADALGLAQGARGALVQNLDERGPSRDAGVRLGDVIVRYRGQVVSDGQDLRERVAKTRPGTVVSVVVMRDGRERIVKVALSERPTDLDLGNPIQQTLKRIESFGMTLLDLTPELARSASSTLGEGGLLLESVERGSPADMKGLKPGDIIRELNWRTLRSLSEYELRVRGLDDGEGVLLRIERDGRFRFFALRKR